MKPRRLGITLKLTLVLIIFASTVLISVGAISYNSGRIDLEAATISELISIATEKESALEAWVNGKTAIITIIASMAHFVDDVNAIVNASAGVTVNPDNMAGGGAVTRNIVMRELLAQVGPRKPFETLEVIEPVAGKVIAGTDSTGIGRIKIDEIYYTLGKTQTYVHNPSYSPDLNKPALIVSAPLIMLDGRLVGVLVGQSDLKELTDIIQRRFGLHQTDETYLIDSSYRFVIQPRFLTDNAQGVASSKTDPEINCVAHNNGVQFASDYRSVPAIIVYRWLPSQQLCLVVKLDQAEAFASINDLGKTFLLVGTLAVVAVTILAINISRTLTQPILKLRTGASRLGSGDLSVRLPETSRDELGELAHEFNMMAVSLAQKDEALRRANLELEREVQERTASLRESEIELRSLLAAMTDVILVIDSQGRFLRIIFTKSLLRYKLPAELVGKTVSDIFSRSKANAFLEDIQLALSTSQSLDREYSFMEDEDEIWLSLTVSPMSDDTVLCVARDITDRVLMEDELQNTVRDLLRSNEDLQQFAYIASHDLQEPLRMVTSYMELMSRRYQGKLDEQADKYISYAVDGANRMQQLIRDLLTYSRVSTQEKEFVMVDTSKIITNVLQNLKVVIEECGAIVTCDPLPVVKADEIQLSQLFQNLIANAIKFRTDMPPQIHVSARKTQLEWIFSIRDNGIGIAPEYAERIFVIFKRLHTRKEYPGTGLGLAICKKIVEQHVGRIWVESQLGNGSTFFFGLPLEEQ